MHLTTQLDKIRHPTIRTTAEFFVINNTDSIGTTATLDKLSAMSRLEDRPPKASVAGHAICHCCFNFTSVLHSHEVDDEYWMRRQCVDHVFRATVRPTHISTSVVTDVV